MSDKKKDFMSLRKTSLPEMPKTEKKNQYEGFLNKTKKKKQDNIKILKRDIEF